MQRNEDPHRFNAQSRFISYDFYPPGTDHYFPGVVAGGLGGGFLAFGLIDREWWMVGGGSLFFLFGCLLVVRHRTRFDLTNRLVFSEGHLFGRFCVYRKRLALSDFKVVIYHRHLAGDPSEHPDHIYMGLRKQNGGVIRVQCDTAQRGNSCGLLSHARRLSDLIDLPLEQTEK